MRKMIRKISLFIQKGETVMIEVTHVSKEFVSPKKYPGFKGAIKGLFSNEKVVKRAEQEKNELLSIYNRIKEEEEYKGHPKKTKHAALLEFCLKTGIIAKSVEMEISSLQCASSDKDKKLLQTFQDLKQTLENSKTSDASSFFTPYPSLKGFKQKMLRQIRQRLNTAELFQ